MAVAGISLRRRLRCTSATDIQINNIVINYIYSIHATSALVSITSSVLIINIFTTFLMCNRYSNREKPKDYTLFPVCRTEKPKSS